MVHVSDVYARQKNRLSAFACTTSIGPGATNMVTGAALATVNRLPVLLLPGDVFSSRRPDPVLQQLETPWAGDVSVNDVFRPVSRYFDRIWRPEQLIPAALSAMRVLTSQADTGAVTLALPQDVQAEAHDWPEAFFERRVWRISRPAADPGAVDAAAALVRGASRPMIVAGGARTGLGQLVEALEGWSTGAEYAGEAGRLAREWDAEVERLYTLGHSPLPAQSEVLGAVNSFSDPTDVVVCAAGSMPGDLHKLWRTRDRKQYHVEYGYSCMGYEIAGALGVKLAAPEREVYALVGDGSYLMLSEAIVTSLQEHAKLVVVLVDNHGFASIGGLSRSLGTAGFGTQFRFPKEGHLGTDTEREPAPYLPTDLAKNAESLGAHVIRARSIAELRDALAAAKKIDRTVVIYIEVDRQIAVGGYGAWWDVPVAEVSSAAAVRTAREGYEKAKPKQRR